MWFTVLAVAALSAIVYWAFFSKSKNVWEKYGVRQVDVSPAVSTFRVFLAKQSLCDGDDYAYKTIGSEKFCGLTEFRKPILLIKDLDLAKKILIKDFEYFIDRREFFDDVDNMLKKMLANLKGEQWKGVRNAISPTFTTGKIRRMMEWFNSVGIEWVEDLKAKAKQNGGNIKMDVFNSVNQYTIDVIASAVFGIYAGTVKNIDSPFFKNALDLSNVGPTLLLKFALGFQFPKLFKLLRLELFSAAKLGFFRNILEQGLQQRSSGEVKRNDFLQLLVEARKGELKAVGNDELSAFEKEAQVNGVQDRKEYLTNDVMIAQGVGFFFAGFSTTSNFITFATYVLALHQDIQEKLRPEVDKIMGQDGNLDYDQLNQLVYLDMVLCEVHRKFPALGRLERLCVNEYRDPENGLTVPKGTLVFIPINAIHNDKEFYEYPEKFYPEHFTPEKKASRNPYAYMPFGMGPRNCIGMRFAQVESKAAIAHLVHNFRIEPTAKTPVPLQTKPAGFQLLPPAKLELQFIPIK